MTAILAGMARKRPTEDPVMGKVRALFKASGLSLHDLGLKMGYAPETARQAVWQFLRTGDPHLSVLRRFALALGVPIEELVVERKGEEPSG
jgi:transcriptional regulator with XRE-family HTH domain